MVLIIVNNNFIVFCQLLLIVNTNSILGFHGTPSPVICQEPQLGAQKLNLSRYLVISYPSLGKGFGNEIVFFPSLYMFAAVSGRGIIICDGGLIFELCSIITCGFPYYSNMASSFPVLLPWKLLKHPRHIRTKDFISFVEGKYLVENTVIVPDGFFWKSNWWITNSEAAECARKISGCELYDVLCVERHAYQSLIRGPFLAKASEQHQHRIVGMPSHIKHGILSLPYSYAPRVSASVHFRAQFDAFENMTGSADQSYRDEVFEWLNSSTGQRVFSDMESMLTLKLQSTQHSIDQSALPQNISYVYVAADDAYVKDAFIRMIEHKYPNIKAMRIESNNIGHTKDVKLMKNMTNNEGVFDMVFDWYTLSLSNVVLAWRRNTNMLSTYIATAVKVSGERGRKNLSESKYDETLGVGSRGMQLHYDKNGKALWSSF